MTETFDHLFGGYKSAKARRWRNADGSEGHPGLQRAKAKAEAAKVPA